VSRVIALDHGSRRIGVAVADPETGMAFARPAIRGRRLESILDEVAGLCATEGAELVVIGLPRNMDGSEGVQAQRARAFGEALTARGLRVAYEDERLTSWEATQRLAEAGRRPGRASGELDSAAARLILQQYLDARREGPRHPEETE
jgi:putative Holliday junction resolvase